MSGAILAIILVYFFEFSVIEGVATFLASFLVDLDHYPWYAVSFRDWNPFHALRWHNQTIDRRNSISVKEKAKFQRGVFVLHSLVVWIVLGFLSSINTLSLSIFLGFSLHIVADLITLAYYNEPLYTKLFPCLVIIRNKNKKPLKEL